jgi:hypothetical protein
MDGKVLSIGDAAGKGRVEKTSVPARVDDG